MQARPLHSRLQQNSKSKARFGGPFACRSRKGILCRRYAAHEASRANARLTEVLPSERRFTQLKGRKRNPVTLDLPIVPDL